MDSKKLQYIDFVKIHDVVRDVTKWIANTFGDEPLERIPHKILAFPALRVLNLSHTSIRALPSSVNSFCQLRALIVQITTS